MAEYKRQTGIALIIAEKEDGTYDVNMGSNADLPQNGLPVLLYTGILNAVCDNVAKYNRHLQDKENPSDRFLKAVELTHKAAQELLYSNNEEDSREF